jgi:Chromo (CHRromatin Organisation MOdifier) domain
MVAYNSSVHSSTGFTPQEIIRAEAPRVLLSGPTTIPMADKGTWLRKVLENLAVVRKKAKENLKAAKRRYKCAYDAHIRNRNANLQVGDWVLVKVFTESPKLTLPLAGPYELAEVDERNGTYVIETAEGLCRVPSDRVKPAPYPRDLPAHSPAAARPTNLSEEDANEYVIERVISHGRNESGDLIVRVRWAGYGSSDDTWERPQDLPNEALLRYERRKKLVRGTVSVRA